MLIGGCGDVVQDAVAGLAVVNLLVALDLGKGLRADVNQTDLADFLAGFGERNAAVGAGDAVVGFEGVLDDASAELPALRRQVFG